MSIHSDDIDSPQFITLLNSIIEIARAKAFAPDELASKTRDFILSRVSHYANHLGHSPLEILTAMEKKRPVTVPDYYNSEVFPRLDLGGVFVLRDLTHYKQIVGVNGFRCPRCGEVSLLDPYQCHEWIGKRKCSWSARSFFGTFGKGLRLVIRDVFLLEPIVYDIFMPIALEPLFENGALIPGATFPE